VKKTILILEPDPDMKQVLARTLARELGNETETVLADGRDDVLRRLVEDGERYDLLITNLRPESSFESFIRLVREQSQVIPTILFTGSEIEATDAAVDAIVQKTDGIRTLLQVAGALMSGDCD
jgi:DNA-binding NtrC family response regulator